ncbi:MAG: amidohydrolase family protein [Acidimicrobiales bacterium]
MIVNLHGGTGSPNYGDYPVADLLFIMDVAHYSHRPFGQLLLSGVFERFPELKFVMTEQGAAWLPGMLRRMDAILERIRTTGRTGEPQVRRIAHPSPQRHRLLPAELLARREPTRAEDAAAAKALGIDKFMWGSDYPHREAPIPSPGNISARCSRAWTPPRSSRCSAPTVRICTASTWTPSHRSPPSTGRRTRRSRSRCGAAPEPNEALLKGVGSVI